MNRRPSGTIPDSGGVLRPVHRHIVTCIPCGYREAVKRGNAYPERCPACGRPLEHYETEIADKDELQAIDRPPRIRITAK